MLQCVFTGKTQDYSNLLFGEWKDYSIVKAAVCKPYKLVPEACLQRFWGQYERSHGGQQRWPPTLHRHINKPENTLRSRLAVDFLALPLNTVLCKRFQGSTAHTGDIRALNCSHCSLHWVVFFFFFF